VRFHRPLAGAVLALASVISLAGQGQSGSAWAQPYRQAPSYWELVGRLFADSPDLRRDRGFRGFLDPSVLAAGSIKPNTKEGEILATFVRFLIVQEENRLNLNLPPDRLVTADVTQVLFTSADRDSLRIDVRTGNPSPEFQQCFDSRHQRFAHMVDVRLQAAMMCEGALFWTAWRMQATALDPTAQSMVRLDNLGTLVLTFNAKAAVLNGSIQSP
jgi:hypothetical protein